MAMDGREETGSSCELMSSLSLSACTEALRLPIFYLIKYNNSNKMINKYFLKKFKVINYYFFLMV